MQTPLNPSSLRRGGAAFAITAVVLLGCARKVQVIVPAGYHGSVRILCTGLTEDRSTILRVDGSGQLTTGTCPVRQTDTLVIRDGASSPMDTAVMWTTTGDGLVREITFNVR